MGIPRNWSLGVLPLVGALFSLSLVHCGAATVEQLEKRASFDLDCPAEKIDIVEIDSSTMGVSGCGQRATYVESCDAAPNNPARECTWVLNSETRPVKKKKKRAGPRTLDSPSDEES
jgi:hypothetical protein